eukprot:Rhum_TRINITY_DN11455_c0_g1::Rhum_TRINITY_DN11455_c0_g1_i1::g.44891::m.44891
MGSEGVRAAAGRPAAARLLRPQHLLPARPAEAPHRRRVGGARARAAYAAGPAAIQPQRLLLRRREGGPRPRLHRPAAPPARRVLRRRRACRALPRGAAGGGGAAAGRRTPGGRVALSREGVCFAERDGRRAGGAQGEGARRGRGSRVLLPDVRGVRQPDRPPLQRARQRRQRAGAPAVRGERPAALLPLRRRGHPPHQRHGQRLDERGRAAAQRGARWAWRSAHLPHRAGCVERVARAVHVRAQRRGRGAKGERHLRCGRDRGGRGRPEHSPHAAGAAGACGGGGSGGAGGAERERSGDAGRAVAAGGGGDGCGAGVDGGWLPDDAVLQIRSVAACGRPTGCDLHRGHERAAEADQHAAAVGAVARQRAGQSAGRWGAGTQRRGRRGGRSTDHRHHRRRVGASGAHAGRVGRDVRHSDDAAAGGGACVADGQRRGAGRARCAPGRDRRHVLPDSGPVNAEEVKGKERKEAAHTKKKQPEIPFQKKKKKKKKRI